MINQLSSKGMLRVNVFATDIGMPVSNATISIKSRIDGKVLDELVTDSSGQTSTAELAAPNLEYSLNPSEQKPYSEYDISVKMEGYDPMAVDGVQILPDVTALQNVNLKPTINKNAQQQSININEHTLWGNFPPKMPETEVKPLPEPSGFVVLSEPVVPQYIIVHQGDPANTSAPNVYVPFKDYIKNVASCEIYSTWPEESLKANILAILSFTLNRVYTEWYRGKGYNFTVTNSTFYDQAFSYGRNFYERISTIVDDLFTTYVTKPEIRQPLFTQYCDGVKHVCAIGLKQWGSKSLAEQGYTAIRILKYYYGQNIYLTSAKKVAGVPSSYPGTPLQLGSSGANVRIIQEQLNAIAKNYPAINIGKVDGIFGSQTQNAVKKFQEIVYLPSNGIVDFPTWYQISNVYVAVAKLAELI